MPDEEGTPAPGASPPVSISDVSGPSLLRLARASRDAAKKKLRALSPEAQARACLEVRPESRSDFLLLVDRPEDIVPLFPDAEVCMTVRSAGMSDGAWLIELATADQTRACFDLDCWHGDRFEVGRFEEWLQALLEAGPERVVRAVRESDLELWVLWLKRRADVVMTGKEDTPPDGAFTPDGQTHFVPRPDFDPAPLQQLANALHGFGRDLYWGWVHGASFEGAIEVEEFALRWRSGRLADLGFPERSQALELYARLSPEELPPPARPSPDPGLVPFQALPKQLEGSLVGEGLRALPQERAGELLGYVLAVANAVAVADDLTLSDLESLPRALRKTVDGIDSGLRELARRSGEPVERLLDAYLPRDLFRLGATLDPALRKEWRPPDDEDDEDSAEAPE